MEATCPSEISVDFQRTAQRYIPKARTLDNSYYKVKTVILGAVNYKIFETASLGRIP
jgi:hypothetical protein